jgi:sugar O-acyltransferase (sialic acid O-acetyltransferase NeuD family)
MRELVLWGASGHGKVVLDVARTMRDFEGFTFIDDACNGYGREFCGCPMHEASRYLESLSGKCTPQFVVSIGSNEKRARCFQRVLELGLPPATLVHPSAVISNLARIDDGTVVTARVVINAGAQIGKNCILNTAAIVEHDCRVGDHVHLSPGVVLGGRVIVGKYAHVGIGAIALPGVEIGDHAIVGAGAVLLHSVPSGATVVGVPARALVHAGR